MLPNTEEKPTIEESIGILRKLPKDELARLLSLLGNEISQPEAQDPPGNICPHCSGNHIRKNGRVRNSQRFICCTCDRSFGETTGSVRYKSKHSGETWSTYMEAFTLKLTLREAAQKCGIVVSTAFFWRHKILDALCGEIGSHILSGVVH